MFVSDRFSGPIHVLGTSSFQGEGLCKSNWTKDGFLFHIGRGQLGTTIQRISLFLHVHKGHFRSMDPDVSGRVIEVV